MENSSNIDGVDIARSDDHVKRRQHSMSELATFDSAKKLSTITGQLEGNPYYYDLPQYYRWSILLACVIVSIFTGPSFMNWPPFDTMFHWANAYSYLCDPNDPTYESRDHGEIYCAEKERSIAAILPAATSAMFSVDLAAGILLDCTGGKLCTLFGLICEILGWILIGCSSTSFNGYMPGMILIAIGIDPTFFGLMSCANLFPGWQSTIMAILGSARSLSFVNGLVMQQIMNQQRDHVTLKGVSFVFAGMLVLCLIFTLLFIPLQTYPKLPPGQNLNTTEREGKTSYKARIKRKPKFDLQLFISEAKSQALGFLRHALTLPYVLFCFIPIVAFIRLSYYGTSYKYHLGQAVDFYTILSPLSMLPCIPLGILADTVSTVFTLGFLAFCGCLSMLLVMFGNIVALEYISVLVNFIFISFTASQFYVYIAYCYPQEHVGKLLGFGLLIGGLSTLIATPMYDFASRNDKFFPMDLLVVLLEIVAIGLCVYLYIAVEKPIRDAVQRKKNHVHMTSSSSHLSNSLEQDEIKAGV